MKLDNGLTALLISDVKPGEDVPSADAQCDGCVTEADAEMSSADEEDEGESEEDDEESDMDEDEDDEDEEPEENSGSDKSGERLVRTGNTAGFMHEAVAYINPNLYKSLFCPPPTK